MILIGAWLSLSSCAVGPNFERPKPPAARNYDTPEQAGVGAKTGADGTTTGADGARTGGNGAKAGAVITTPGADVPAQWWELFKSPMLDQILREAIAGSPTLASAQATLAAAREAVIIARAGYLPRVSATAGAQHAASSGGSLGGAGGAGVLAGGGAPGGNFSGSDTSTSYSLGLTASYTFNAFGGATLRMVEQQQALADSQRYQLAGTYLTLTGSVVNEALGVASARLQIAITLDLLANDQKNLDLTERMFEVGAAARTDVLTAESQLASDQTSLPGLQQQLSVARHALAVLVGHSPADWQAPDFDLHSFALPAAVPLSLPSALVRQRPDILAAEAQLHAASANIGIAVAQEYPSITLSGSLTRDALTAANLFHDFDRVWNLGGTLAQPLFAGGALRAQTRQARDECQAEAASYTQVVLTAFGQVADDLRALDNDTERVMAFARALRIASDSLALQRISYAAGKTTILQLIDAERSYSQSRLGNAGAQVQQFEDAVNLFVALGGGWWNSSIAPPAAQTSLKP
jgi:NodT family efflux transporter outer membrane factor (OMF) lipoprotein